MKKIILSLTLLCSASIFANGQSYFTGNGTVEKMPTCVDITVTLQGECYPDITSLTTAVVNNSNEIYNHLKELVGEDGDVNNNVGIAREFSRSHGYGEDQVITCKGTWALENQVTVTLKNLDRFSEIYNAMLENNAQVGSKNESAPVVFSRVTGYQAHIEDSIRKEMKLEALSLAVHDAKEQFQTACKASQSTTDVNYCMNFNPRENVRSTNFNESASYSLLSSDSSSPKRSLNIKLEPITVSCYVNIEFVHSHIQSCVMMNN